MYIVIEGQDATGKDTQAKLLKEYYEKQGKTYEKKKHLGANT